MRHGLPARYPRRSLVCLCGVPGAGKTFLAEHLTETRSPGYHLVSVDDCRVEVAHTGNPHDRVVTKLAFDLAYDKARALIPNGPVLFDSTALTIAARRSLVRFARSCGARPHLLVVHTPRGLAVERNERRDERWRVPADRFDSMWRDYSHLRANGARGFASVRLLRGDAEW